MRLLVAIACSHLGRTPCLLLDARYEKLQHGGCVSDCAVLLAVSITPAGKRTVLGISVSLGAADVVWREFRASLGDRPASSRKRAFSLPGFCVRDQITFRGRPPSRR